MLLFVCFTSLLLSSSVRASVGEIVGVGLEAALQQIDNVWSGDAVRYWKCAIENRSSKTLIALGTTPESGSLATVLPDIPPGGTGAFAWEKSRGAATGAIGVIHYKYGNQILNLMASIPYDWNLYYAWSNARVSSRRESFYNLYNGKGGCAYPTKAGNWGEVDGVKFFLTNKSHAELKVYFFG